MLAGRTDSSISDLAVVGWGSTAVGGAASNILRVATVRETNLARCNASYGGILTRNMMCAGGGMQLLAACWAALLMMRWASCG
jgi:hypothetical protein